MTRMCVSAFGNRSSKAMNSSSSSRTLAGAKPFAILQNTQSTAPLIPSRAMSATPAAGPAGMTPVEKAILGLGAAATALVVGLEFAHVGEIGIFVCAALTLVALAWILGAATEQLGEHLGGRVAGFLN